MAIKDKLSSKDYLIYTVRLYNTSKQAENESKNYYRSQMTFPKKYCFGSIDTYEFSYNYDASIEQTNKEPKEKLEDTTIENKIKLADQSLIIYKKTKGGVKIGK